jgi:hypothetical protein
MKIGERGFCDSTIQVFTFVSCSIRLSEGARKPCLLFIFVDRKICVYLRKSETNSNSGATAVGSENG